MGLETDEADDFITSGIYSFSDSCCSSRSISAADYDYQ